jgi:hypothetical protein
LGCLSEASSQNSARLTEQTGPEGEIFVGAAYFGLPFLAVKEMDSEQRERITKIFFLASKTLRSSKVTGVWGNAPYGCPIKNFGHDRQGKMKVHSSLFNSWLLLK